MTLSDKFLKIFFIMIATWCHISVNDQFIAHASFYREMFRHQFHKLFFLCKFFENNKFRNRYNRWRTFQQLIYYLFTSKLQAVKIVRKVRNASFCFFFNFAYKSNYSHRTVAIYKCGLY